MSNSLAYALLLIYQHRAPNSQHQDRLHQLLLTFLAGELTPEQYERNLHTRPPMDRRKLLTTA